MNWLSRCALLLVLGANAGCGGGAGDGAIAEGGISGTGIAPAGVSIGPVSEFGSVRINGTRLEITPATEVRVHGEAATQADLRVGQVVRVEADFDAGTAHKIEYYATLRGPVESIAIVNPDTLRATLSVMGQTVRTTASTQFDGLLGPDALRVGDIVEVSGTRDAANAVAASFVARRSPGGVYRVTGRIENPTATTLRIAGLTIAHDSAERSPALPEPLSEGLLVRVTGAAAGYSPGVTRLVADRLEPGLALAAQLDAAVETEGFVTRFEGLSDFDVDGQPVDAGAARIEGGGAADVDVDVRVEVEGSIAAGGVLDATRVVLQTNAFVRIDARVEEVDPVAATLTLLGLPVTVPAAANIEDERSGGGGIGGVAGLAPGMQLELRGFLRGGAIVATRIEVEDPEDRALLLAPVGASDRQAGELTLLGLTIRASTALGTEFENEAEAEVGEDEFYASLRAGRLVKVRWDLFSSIAEPVDEASLEID